MNAAIRARLADAVELLSDLDALMERADAGRLPPILQARTMVRLAAITARLARMRQGVRDALDDGQGVSTRHNVAKGR